ncbi:hypothetical protein ACFMKD_32635, partial [Acinetobacter baumannii]
WHETIVQAIECGQKEGEFKNRSNSTDIAWRLIAFVCGLEGIYKLGLQGLAEEDFKRHTEAIIRLELFKGLSTIQSYARDRVMPIPMNWR